MRIIFTTTVLLATLSACGGGDSTESPKTSPSTSVSVFKVRGVVQCEPAELSLDEMQGQLTAANVEVHGRSCGTDGVMYAAVCGAPTSRIGIFEIPATQLGAAQSAGFAPLSDLPHAKKVPCG